MSDDSVAQEFRGLENKRCVALTSGDVAILAELLTEDLVHIHGNGQMDDKAAHLYGIDNKYTFHRIERDELKIRVYGDIVMVNGPLDQTVSVSGSTSSTTSRR